MPDGHGYIVGDVVALDELHEVGGVSETSFDVEVAVEEASQRVIAFEPVIPEIHLGMVDVTWVNEERSFWGGEGGHVVGFMEVAGERLDDLLKMSFMEMFFSVGNLSFDKKISGADELGIEEAFEETSILLKGELGGRQSQMLELLC